MFSRGSNALSWDICKKKILGFEDREQTAFQKRNSICKVNDKVLGGQSKTILFRWSIYKRCSRTLDKIFMLSNVFLLYWEIGLPFYCHRIFFDYTKPVQILHLLRNCKKISLLHKIEWLAFSTLFLKRISKPTLILRFFRKVFLIFLFFSSDKEIFAQERVQSMLSKLFLLIFIIEQFWAISSSISTFHIHWIVPDKQYKTNA